MATLVSFAVTAAVLVLVTAPVLAGGISRHSQSSSPYSPGAPMRHMESAAQQPRHMESAAQQPRHGDPVTTQRSDRAPAHASVPAAPASPYQPSYSIDNKEWWQPHPYFQSNGQGFGYPTRPVRPYAGYGADNR